MYIINKDRLKKGDIILTFENTVTSKAVRKTTNGNFSHAILHVGGGSYIHSDSKGVHSANLTRLVFDSKEKVSVLRVNCNSAQLEKVCRFGRDKVGMQYSIKDAINTKLKLSKIENKNRQFCSRLVAQAYEFAGIKLVDNPSFCSPQEILDSRLTKEILHVTKQASDAELAFANSKNPIERQTQITNAILDEVRKVTKQDIQTLTQISEFVIQNPTFDDAISNIYINSGYLTLWRGDIAKNPWRYNGQILLNCPIPKAELYELANSELTDAKERFNRYKEVFAQYSYIDKTSNLKYSKINIELYKNLLASTSDNIKAAMYVLENIDSISN